MTASHRILTAGLLLLAGVFAWGFRDDPPVLAFAALPPLMLAAAVALRIRGAGFWAGVLALGWFSYGVMEAWTLGGQARGYALAITMLAVVIVLAVSWDGMRARFGRRADSP